MVPEAPVIATMRRLGFIAPILSDAFPTALDIAADIHPSIAFAREATDFMQARSPAVNTVAGHELDLRMVIVDLPVPSDLQPQPLRRAIKIHDNGAFCVAPRIQQILAALKHKRGIAGPHQAFGVGGWRRIKVIQVPAATLCVEKPILANGAAARARSR